MPRPRSTGWTWPSTSARWERPKRQRRASTARTGAAASSGKRAGTSCSSTASPPASRASTGSRTGGDCAGTSPSRATRSRPARETGAFSSAAPTTLPEPSGSFPIVFITATGIILTGRRPRRSAWPRGTSACRRARAGSSPTSCLRRTAVARRASSSNASEKMPMS